jgi:hypothetical protein
MNHRKHIVSRSAACENGAANRSMEKAMNARAIVVTGGVAAVLFIGGAFAQNPQPSHAPGLVESMLTAQSHHAKLWFAGNAQNWELAEYQIDELEEGLEDTAKNVPDYKGVPVGKMIESLIMAPIAEVESAVKSRDRARFTAAYDKLTAACNSCHEGANRGFIVIVRPAATAFPNQSFAPRRK